MSESNYEPCLVLCVGMLDTVIAQAWMCQRQPIALHYRQLPYLGQVLDTSLKDSH